MSRLQQYLHSASVVLKAYQGEIPFATWLKNYFKANKKFGSKDRKLVADLCFCYFRIGAAFLEKPLEERILIGQFLCHDKSSFVTELRPAWQAQPSESLSVKLEQLGGAPLNIFPLHNELSSEISSDAFCLSHLIQPDVFLRARRNKKQLVEQKLSAANIPFTLNSDCIRLQPATNVDEVVLLDKEAVVQDKNSQAVISLLQTHWHRQDFSVWDCCAASGGKTILLRDHYPQAKLTVSDIRPSIIHNLRARFSRAGISQYRSAVIDMTAPHFSPPETYDLVICDAPCSGSGTWARAPENLAFFLEEKLAHYQQLQQRIAVNACKAIKPDGGFLYITCSVFAKENEQVVDYLQQQIKLKLIEQRYFKGYEEKADTLFAAFFRLQSD